MVKLEISINIINLLSAILPQFLSYYSSFKLLENIKFTEKTYQYFLWIFLSSFFFVTLQFFPAFFLQIQAIFPNSAFYIKLDLTLIVISGAIVCLTIGFIIAFIPIYKLRSNFAIINTTKDQLFSEYISEKLYYQKSFILYFTIGAIFIGAAIGSHSIFGLLFLRFSGDVEFDWKFLGILIGCNVLCSFLLIFRIYSSKFIVIHFLIPSIIVVTNFFTFYTTNFNLNNKKIDLSENLLYKYDDVYQIVLLEAFTGAYIMKEISENWKKKNLASLSSVKKLIELKKGAKSYLEKLLNVTHNKNSQQSIQPKVYEIQSKHIFIDNNNRDVSAIFPTEEIKKTQENSYLFDNFAWNLNR